MNHSKYFTFNTNLGICGCSWSEKGLLSFSLPEKSSRDLELKFEKNSCIKATESILPDWLKNLISKSRLHFEGRIQNFHSTPLDQNGLSEFSKLILNTARLIPAGTTISYKDLSFKINRPGSSRAVGTALGKNPFLLVVPCHRIINTSGKLGGFSAYGGIELKKKILGLEGKILT